MYIQSKKAELHGSDTVKVSTTIHGSVPIQLQYEFTVTRIQLQSLRDTEPQNYRKAVTETKSYR